MRAFLSQRQKDISGPQDAPIEVFEFPSLLPPKLLTLRCGERGGDDDDDRQVPRVKRAGLLVDRVQCVFRSAEISHVVQALVIRKTSLAGDPEVVGLGGGGASRRSSAVANMDSSGVASHVRSDEIDRSRTRSGSILGTGGRTDLDAAPARGAPREDLVDPGAEPLDKPGFATAHDHDCTAGMASPSNRSS